MSTIAKLVVQLGLDSSQLDSGLSGSKGTLASWGDSLTGAGKKLTAGVTLPIVAGGLAAIKWGSDLNEATSAVNTVFGDSADQVAASQGSVAKSLGLSREQALSGAASLGALYKGAGLGTDQMAQFSDQTLQAAADLGSFYNVPVDQALADIRSGLVGEAEPLRKYGILLSDSAVQQEAVRLGLVNSGDALTEQQKLLARQSLIMDGMGAAQGDFARTSDGLANKTRIVTAEFKDSAAQLGQKLLPFALQAVEGFGKLIDKFNGLSPTTQKWIMIIAGAAAVIGPILLVLGSLATALSAVIAIAPLVGAAFTIMTGPVGIIIIAVAALAYAFSTNMFGIRDIAMNVVNAVIGFFGQLVGWFTGGGLSGIITAISGFVGDLIGWGETALKYYVLWPYYLGKALLDVLPAIIDFAAQGLDIITGWAGDVWDALTGFVADVIDTISGLGTAFGNIYNVFLQVGKDIMNGLINGIKGLFDTLAGWVDDIIGQFKRIPGLGNSPWPMMIGAGQDAMNGLIIGIEQRQRALASTVGATIGSITPMADPLSIRLAPMPATAGSGRSSDRSFSFGSGAIVVNNPANGEQVVKEILRAVKRVEAGAV